MDASRTAVFITYELLTRSYMVFYSKKIRLIAKLSAEKLLARQFATTATLDNVGNFPMKNCISFRKS